ncbi:hypothetical protein LAZ67_15003281 [Cordylochernes scorpioides]|uniref:Uncharacterized protein n=1 Tax=Cordylochernes scorpioides TaxID=51811 RepID=A0ABY6LA63_9ARAC|nr:hypothetical protein LAZ67_15003281 [Cordylochernes scorpioides]
MSASATNQIARCIRKPTFGSWARKLASKKIQLSAFKAESDVVELLLGADINPKIATANMIRLSDDRKTEGKFPDKNPNQVHNSMLITSLLTQEIKISDYGLWKILESWMTGKQSQRKRQIRLLWISFGLKQSDWNLAFITITTRYSRMGENGIIERIQSDQDNTLEYFLPHRAVVKSGSSTTPVRPVFDASVSQRVDGL